ncbi:MAG TPA: CNP1-like family protein [Burkholderiales bacterium]
MSGARLLAVAALLAGCSGAPLQSDWEREHLPALAAEQEPAPPPFPRAADLAAIDVPGAGAFRFYVDARTLSVGRDRIVRYVLVARSASGAENVSFEAIRCATRQYRIYAIGHRDGTWGGSPTEWRTLRGSAVPPARRALYQDYFCADAMPVRDTEEALAALHQVRRTRDVTD